MSQNTPRTQVSPEFLKKQKQKAQKNKIRLKVEKRLQPIMSHMDIITESSFQVQR